MVRNVEFLRDRFEGLDTASFSSLQKWPEYVRHFSKVVEIFLRKCWKNAHESLSPLTQEKRAVFSCVIRLFRNEKGILLKKKFDPRLLLGLLWGRAGQLSAIFLSVPSNNPRSLCESYWPIFPLLFLITIPEVFAKVNSTQFLTRFWSDELYHLCRIPV